MAELAGTLVEARALTLPPVLVGVLVIKMPKRLRRELATRLQLARQAVTPMALAEQVILFLPALCVEVAVLVVVVLAELIRGLVAAMVALVRHNSSKVVLAALGRVGILARAVLAATEGRVLLLDQVVVVVVAMEIVDLQLLALALEVV